jgi:hypothetical protein
METPRDRFEYPAPQETDGSMQPEAQSEQPNADDVIGMLKRAFPGLEIVEEDDELVLKDKTVN